ncbi:helicase-related protein [Entomobacter blattae]|uniref:Uncharacterized protein n=1 Tax=Entomobacter blattae TaxID=2762277 RepID=A0A7H1NUM1_9PROT|nr:helicase-related protein [Entomobacter blattae]QNT79481.1 hypothetical protein JGUZn3_22800 [Entomobacter blattae]
MMHKSPAEQAMEYAVAQTGLSLERREIPLLLRRIARLLPPRLEKTEQLDDFILPANSFIRLVCDVRRKKWTSRLIALCQSHSIAWASREDILSAAHTITLPEPDDGDLLQALEKTLANRLTQATSQPEHAFDLLISEIEETKPAPLSAKQLEAVAGVIAKTFKVPDQHQFCSRIIHTYKEQQAKIQLVEKQTHLKLASEKARHENWENSLVDFHTVSELLSCSTKEALRWIAEQRIPVVRRLQQGEREIWQFDPEEVAKLAFKVHEWRQKGHSKSKKHSNKKHDRHTDKPHAAWISLSKKADTGDKSVQNATIANIAALDRYASHFATARALKRHITLVTGPTNSGKSHMALRALADSQSGYALAPLRLLAHEFRETLMEYGLSASLVTGEERILVPSSPFLAATVEMCPFHSPVDVAIIDEAQMLFDEDRGAAWTAAIMGVPARHLYILGAPEAIPIIRRIAKLCDDPIDEISLQRKTPLTASLNPVRLSNLKKGDAVIAFSRRDVLDIRAALLAQNKKVAVVYGALSPEVRRAEAQRFNSGQADILVATDAIGMGLNLKIRRIIFATLRKFDGSQIRDLTTQEVKQIGGRAGRYGHHDAGIVSVLAGAGNPHFIKHHLEAPTQPPTELRPLVQPDIEIIQAIAEEIRSESLFGVLTRINRAVLRADDPNYRLADMSQSFAIAAALEGIPDLTLSQRWTYALCPIDERDEGISRLTRWALKHATNQQILPPGTGHLPAPEKTSREELELAEKRYKRLVAWRWLALRFPDVYINLQEAEHNTAKLNSWIENVLRQQSRMKTRH